MKRLVIILILLCLPAFSGPPVFGQSISSTDTTKVHSMRGTYYSDKFVGRKTSSGEIFRQDRYTAAHRTLKFGTLVLVTNPKNGEQVIVKVNDRCPINNVLDLTRTAARAIGIGSGIVHVQVLPDRYYPYWEQQDQLKEIMKKGEFLTYAQQSNPVKESQVDSGTDEKRENKGTTHRKAPSTTTDDVAKASHAKEKKAPSAATHKTGKTPAEEPEKSQTQNSIATSKIYNIELGCFASRNTAEKEVKRLPIYYQDQVVFKTRLNQNDVMVILQLESHHDNAQKALLEVKKMFPNATIIEKNK